MFQAIYTWIAANKEWFFDGLGVVLLTGLAAFLLKLFHSRANKDDASQSQTGGDNSINFQIGRDLKISSNKEEKDARKKKSNERR